jgi:hypothetical protein
MSTKSAKGPSTESSDKSDVVEVRLKGPGATTLGLVDGMGNVLMARRVMVAGPDEVEMKFQMPLSLSTTMGQIAAVPIVFHQTSAKQLVTVGGKDPAAASAERQSALKLNAGAIGKIKAATEAAAAQIRETGRLMAPVRR